MTEMPRPRMLDRRSGPRRRPLRGWHAACILVGSSGCFVFGPPNYLPENNPPQVVESSFPDEGDSILLESETETLFVIATDEDGDDLGFIWTIDGRIVPDAVAMEDGSWVEVRVAERTDGEIVECKIYDGLSDPVTLDAVLEIP